MINSKSIAFYIAGEKHLENIKKITHYLPNYRISIFTSCMNLIDGKRVKHIELLKEISRDTRAVCLFMAYPTSERLDIQEFCLLNNIPCYAIEEGNQLTLNNGRVNHYFTPLDLIFVPSIREKELLIKQHVFCDNLISTGWAFYGNDKNLKNQQLISQKALLFLSPLSKIDIVSNEMVGIRKKIIKLVKRFVSKSDYSLTIKLHPNEKSDININKLLLKEKLKATVILGTCDIQSLILNHSLILSRGNSQTILEALYQDKKIGIINIGKNIFPEIFHLNMDTSIPKYLDSLNSQEYEKEIKYLKRVHIGDTKYSALKIAEYIHNVKNFKRDDDRFSIHLCLLFYLLNKKEKSYNILSLVNDNNKKEYLKDFLTKSKKRKVLFELYKIFNNDILVKRYLSKIFIDSSYLHVITHDLELTPKNEVPFFWGKNISQENKIKKIIDITRNLATTIKSYIRKKIS